MTNSPVPGPRSPWRDWDELIAVFVAFGAIGTVLFWGLGRQNNAQSWLPAIIPAPQPTASPNALVPGLTGPGLTRPGLTGPGDRLNPQENAFPRLTPPMTRVTPGPVAPAPVAPVPVPAPVLPPVGLTPPNSSVVSSGTLAPASVVPGALPNPTPTANAEAPAVVIVRPTTSPVAFPDVTADYWASPFILAMSQRGASLATVGGNFEPDRPATRVEYAAELEKIFQPARTQPPLAFQDVPASYPAIAAVNSAVQSGFMRGYSEGLFRPEQPMPRYQVLLSLVNGLQLPAPADPAAVVNTFSDGNEVPAWAIPGVAAAAEAGLVVNPQDARSLQPNRPVTRAELSAMLYQALVASGQAQPIESAAIARP